MFVLPKPELRRLAADADGTALTLLVGRYNYGHQLPYDNERQAGPELTMWPIQPVTSFI